MNGAECTSPRVSHSPMTLFAPPAAVALLLPAPTSDAHAQEGRPAEPPAAGTWAFDYPGRQRSVPLLLDLRSLNEEKAGQSGFVRLTADGNGFVLGDGTPARFWAVGSEVYQRSPVEVARHCRFLAGIGVNLVRLHTQIAPKGKHSRIDEFDAKDIDAIWRFVAAAKEQ